MKIFFFYSCDIFKEEKQKESKESTLYMSSKAKTPMPYQKKKMSRWYH